MECPSGSWQLGQVAPFLVVMRGTDGSPGSYRQLWPVPRVLLTTVTCLSNCAQEASCCFCAAASPTSVLPYRPSTCHSRWKTPWSSLAPRGGAERWSACTLTLLACGRCCKVAWLWVLVLKEWALHSRCHFWGLSLSHMLNANKTGVTDLSQAVAIFQRYGIKECMHCFEALGPCCTPASPTSLSVWDVK